MSSTLVWQIVRGYNSSMRKGITGNRPMFSAEAGNLSNAHSYKASGICNANTLDVAASEDATCAVTVGRPKNALKPVSSKKTHIVKKGARKALKSVGKIATSFRPDLKKAAVARAAAYAKANRVKAASN
ncbi:hypothetical protein FOA52_000728 [Chlamydomonas sp. UWO 241]|nr:hypothetical protein FOA52_000728 [Chlamydomonas sp. UWO 241]